MSLTKQPFKSEKVDQLSVQVYENRKDLGNAAAADVTNKIKDLLSQKDGIRMVFAAAPSQNEFLEVLRSDSSIDWDRITVFHMDEYIGLTKGAPQSFSQFLCDRLFDSVKPKEVHLIDSSNVVSDECERYSNLLKEAPIDIVCLGIGENGHIAFNDPPVADFEDLEVIKKVELDEVCRNQQVNDGCFPTFNDVPTHALTLTIPTILSGAHLFCIVPGESKHDAVKNTLNGPVSTSCPASILRSHQDCTLYLDKDSYGELEII
jgi:glucosamine-6-phosphate deaminase